MSQPSRPSQPSRGDGSTAPVRKRARTADVRTALVDAAWWVLEHEGLAGLTVRAVATRAGVAPMGVYNHLRDKDGLLTAVLTRAFEDFAAAITYPAHLPPTEAFTAQGRAYREFALAHPVPYSLMFGLSRTEPPTDGDTAPDLRALHEAGARAFGRLVTGIQAGQVAGTIRRDPPEQIAFAVWSAVHGAVGLESTAGTDPDTARASYEQVLAMITRGIAPD